MFIRRRFYVVQNQAGDGAAAGGAAGEGAGAAAAAGAGDAGAGSASTSSAGADGAAGSVLAGGAAGAGTGGAAAGAGAADPNAWVPEKYRVFKEDKSLDIEASARKVEEARSHLEKRMGSGDIPPKTAEEYKVNVPEKLAAQFKSEDLSKDPLTVQFLKDAHAAGMTQKQVDFALASYLERLPAVSSAAQQMKADECTAELKSAWKTEEDFTKNVRSAYRAAEAYGGEDFKTLLNDYGNDPRIVRMLAKVGSEMGEDTSAGAQAQGAQQADIEALQKSKAYWDPKDPQHEITKQRVADHYARLHGSTAKRTGAQTFNLS